MSFYRETGNLILATRLKRLSEKILNEITAIYKHFKIHFETSWFPVYYLLNKENILTLSQISEKLEITHSAVSQMITSLKKKGLVEILSDNIDERKKYIQLSENSKKMLPQLNRVWEVLENSIFNQFNSVAEQNKFMETLERLEDNLAESKLSKEAIVRMQKLNQLIKILPYTIKYNAAISEFIEKNYTENIDINIQNAFLAISKNNEILGIVIFKRQGQNILIDNLLLDKSIEKTAVIKAIFDYLTVKYFQTNKGYFIFKNINEQHLGYILKFKIPFMVKF